jgi:endonuclease/exonuclease/phosphatase family metal-dependent hydrolase
MFDSHTLQRAIRLTSWGYLSLAVLLWMVIQVGGDRWWPAGLILFGPRWLAALPLIILVPLSIWQGRRALLPLLLGTLVVFGPFMGLCLPLGKTGKPSGPAIRVLTCNINSGDFSALALSELIRETGADIVALQECPRELKLKLPSEWRTVQEGELAVLSRYPLQIVKTVQALHPPHKWPRTCLLQCVVQAPGGDLAFNTVHLPSPRYGLQTILDRTTLLNLSRKGLLIEETAHRWQTAREVQNAVALQALPTIVAGDFNMPIDSAIYHKVWGGYGNAFSKVGCGYGWTEWNNVRGVKIGVRIDHVLTGKGLEARVCETGGDVGSDHLPLIADLCRS